MELETLREHLPDDIILHNVLRHAISTKDYSLISTYNTKDCIIDFINSANLAFDTRTIAKYEDYMLTDDAISASIHFNLTLSPGGDYHRYSEGIVHIVVEKEDYGYVIIECGLKVLYVPDNEWEDIDVEHLTDEYLTITYVPSVTEVVNIASGVVSQCISDHVISSTIKISYDVITQVSILYNTAVRRANDLSMNKHILAMCKARVLRGLEYEPSYEFKLELSNLCEYIAHEQLSGEYDSAINNVKRIVHQLELA
jgi:hypothetical protein